MDRFRMFPAIALSLLTASLAHANIILNGDFEDNSAASSQFNLPNASFDAVVANATAFGSADELDLVTGSDFGVSPQSGSWKVGLHTQTTGIYDMFSLGLSTPVIAGMSYDLQFFAAGEPDYGSLLGPVQIGLSNSAAAFGTLIFTGTPSSTSAWTQFDYSFMAASGASFLTVRTDPATLDGYAFIDNITMDNAQEVVPEPSTVLFLGTGLIGFVASRRRNRK